ncbi:uncharacterized protein CDAR_427741 [Caerostris darwini]|uniref:Uncharacterized protein n=1 Tax=Caerostris darwini TaxID=1538125 RepID=A0AAV4MBZ1_9ARAC|nr:uncharacterized protein CDAR_427741 [Caerostris darwini]
MGSKNEMPLSKVINLASGMLSSGVKSILDVGNTVCFQMPKRAVVLCFKIQKEIFFLPFRCVNKVFEAIKPPFAYLNRVYRALTDEGPTAVELLTGEKNPSATKIIDSSRHLRHAVLKSIAKENSKSSLSMYQKQLEKWKLENEKRTEEMFKITIEERELMKAVASALRYLKSLKNKREKMNDNYSKNIVSMINTGTLSGEKILTMQKDIKNIDAVINEKKNACLNFLNQGSIAIADDLIGGLKSYKSETQPIQNHDDSQTSSSTEVMQKCLSIVMDENQYLKNRLTSTHNKLEDILRLSENINYEILNLSEKFTKMIEVNSEMAHLQLKLDQERDMLKNVEADRDLMRDKLQTLEFMIQEEEDFLGTTESEASDSCFLSFSEDSSELDSLSK